MNTPPRSQSDDIDGATSRLDELSIRIRVFGLETETRKVAVDQRVTQEVEEEDPKVSSPPLSGAEQQSTLQSLPPAELRPLRMPEPVPLMRPEPPDSCMTPLSSSDIDVPPVVLRAAIRPHQPTILSDPLGSPNRIRSALLVILACLGMLLVVAILYRATDPLEPPAPESLVPIAPAPEPPPTPAPDPPVLPPPKPVTVVAPDEIPWSAKPHVRRVAIASSLRAKPDLGSLKVADLRVGARVLVYDEFPAPEGWVLAHRPAKEIGFMLADHLDKASPKPRSPRP
jgi:hypothetical protein